MSRLARGSPARSPSPQGVASSRSPSPQAACSSRERSPSPQAACSSRSPSPQAAPGSRSPSPQRAPGSRSPSPQRAPGSRSPSPQGGCSNRSPPAGRAPSSRGTSPRGASSRSPSPRGEFGESQPCPNSSKTGGNGIPASVPLNESSENEDGAATTSPGVEVEPAELSSHEPPDSLYGVMVSNFENQLNNIYLKTFLTQRFMLYGNVFCVTIHGTEKDRYALVFYKQKHEQEKALTADTKGPLGIKFSVTLWSGPSPAIFGIVVTNIDNNNADLPDRIRSEFSTFGDITLLQIYGPSHQRFALLFYKYRIGQEKALAMVNPFKTSFGMVTITAWNKPPPSWSELPILDNPSPAGASSRSPSPAGASSRSPSPAGASSRSPSPAGASSRSPSPVGATSRSPSPEGASNRRPTSRKISEKKNRQTSSMVTNQSNGTVGGVCTEMDVQPTTLSSPERPGRLYGVKVSNFETQLQNTCIKSFLHQHFMLYGNVICVTVHGAQKDRYGLVFYAQKHEREFSLTADIHDHLGICVTPWHGPSPHIFGIMVINLENTVLDLADRIRSEFGIFGDISLVEIRGPTRQRFAMVFYKSRKGQEKALASPNPFKTSFGMVTVTAWNKPPLSLSEMPKEELMKAVSCSPVTSMSASQKEGRGQLPATVWNGPLISIPPPVWNGPPVSIPPPAWNGRPVSIPPPGFSGPRVSIPPPGFNGPPVSIPPPGFNGPPPVSIPPPGFNRPPPVSIPPPGFNGPPVSVPPPGWNGPPVSVPPPGWNGPPVSVPPPGWNGPPVSVPPPGWNGPPVSVPPPGWIGPPVAIQPSCLSSRGKRSQSPLSPSAHTRPKRSRSKSPYSFVSENTSPHTRTSSSRSRSPHSNVSMSSSPRSRASYSRSQSPNSCVSGNPSPPAGTSSSRNQSPHNRTDLRLSLSPHTRVSYSRSQSPHSISSNLSPRTGARHDRSRTPCSSQSYPEPSQKDEKVSAKSRPAIERRRTSQGEVSAPFQKSSLILWINNLEETISSSELRAAFKPFGDIEHIEIKEGFRNIGKQAFLQYNHPASASRAIRHMDGTFFLDCKLQVDFAYPQQATNCLWVYGLHVAEVTEEYLTNVFEQFGHVQKLLYNPVKGAVLVLYNDAATAVKAMDLKTIAGYTVKLGFANRRCQLGFCHSMESSGQDVGDFYRLLEETDIGCPESQIMGMD